MRTYTYKGNLCTTLSMHAKFKDPVTGQWLSPYVVYSNDAGELYIREQDDFIAKFQKVDGEL